MHVTVFLQLTVVDEFQAAHLAHSCTASVALVRVCVEDVHFQLQIGAEVLVTLGTADGVGGVEDNTDGAMVVLLVGDHDRHIRGLWIP